MNQLEKEIQYHYTFRFSNGHVKDFKVRVIKETLTVIRPENGEFPDWAKLSQFKCIHCPLDPEKNEFCPLALNLKDILREFSEYNSFENVDITVETSNRDYHKFTSLQNGISSLLGILMVTSGCPIIGKLKPLLYFHLPFATLDETQVRAFSLYLLSQYIKWKKGDFPDWDMKYLAKIYEDIRIMNHNVSKKIISLGQKDASINSLVILNNFADYVTITLEEKLLNELEFYLKEFL